MAIRSLAQRLPQVDRIARHPAHPFQLRTRPFQIQPFMIAPVLPGETMKNLLLQSRVVSDPVKNQIVGWWCEYYVFYIKHRDLDARDALTAMMLDVTASASSLANTTAFVEFMKPGVYSTVDWVTPCLKRVVEEYFRDEGEAWNTWLLGNVPLAQINGKSWMDSADLRDNIPTGGDATPVGDETIEAMNTARIMWETMRTHGLSDMTYEDFLRTYGVQVAAKEELHRPELIRYARDWKYPSNTVDPVTGLASAALSWSISERADKDRFFKEPGFIFGVTVARPKVYLSGQKAAAVSMLENAFTWLPALLGEEVYTSLKTIAEGAGPISGALNGTTGYVVDVRDLFLYGDQFVNFALTETNANLVALPTAAMQKKYVSSADVDALFTSASPLNQIRQDGVVTMTILGTQRDHTPVRIG